jgi:Protein of unknown function (DUF4240)
MTSLRMASAAVAAALAVSLAGMDAVSPRAASAQSSAPGAKIEPMPDERFWGLIALTTMHGKDPGRQVVALRVVLAALPLHDIEAFQAAFDKAMARSYRWDLWGAAFVVNGGASDDGFEYFRCWLISRGKAAFEQVLADPDSLGDFVDPGTKAVRELEAFAYVAGEVWSARSGRPVTELAEAADDAAHPTQPTGKPFTEDAAHLSARYPKLWSRFGRQPLQ